ncbi:uncharacterized protein LOC134230511 [Saccostrea cucullata]|uniref:uncharacterized protein LOC134230511 n=1 Tax=Saccostrea cuccullata TaxID=36930 RepID=UPI002ED20425
MDFLNPSVSRIYSCARVRVSESVSIPPNSELFIQGYIDGEYRDDEGLLEPSKVVQNKELLMCKSLVTPQHKEVIFPVANLNDRPIKLDRDTIIASLQSFEQTIPFEQKENLKDVNTSNLPEHLEEILQRTSEQLNESQKLSIRNLLVKFQDIFVGPGEPLGRTDLVEHKIETGDSEPFKIPPRRIPIAQREIVEREIQNMLENNIIEASMLHLFV